jgi:hypothetical protein
MKNDERKNIDGGGGEMELVMLAVLCCPLRPINF